MNLPPIFYDDTYQGERYRYGLRYRPLAYANVPKGWIVFSDRPHPDFRHGTVDYPRLLADEEVGAYELTPLFTVCAVCDHKPCMCADIEEAERYLWLHGLPEGCEPKPERPSHWHHPAPRLRARATWG